MYEKIHNHHTKICLECIFFNNKVCIIEEKVEFEWLECEVWIIYEVFTGTKIISYMLSSTFDLEGVDTPKIFAQHAYIIVIMVELKLSISIYTNI